MVGRKYNFDSYRYGFNGKENDKSAGNDNYDFGARVYDGRIGRWLSVDPLQKKYPNITPYHFTLNNPVLFIDPDGKIVIIKDQMGNKVAIVKADGKIIAEKGYENSSLIHYYQQAQSYLKDKGTLSYLEQHTENTSIRIVTDPTMLPVGVNGEDSYNPGSIDYSNAKFNDGNRNGKLDAGELGSVTGVGFKKDEGEIIWDPLAALDDREGNTHSPAMNLDHESKHAKHRLQNANKYFVDVQTVTNDDTDNVEEQTTIRETNQTSRSLNNGDGGTRTKHRGSVYRTKSPTSRERVTPIKSRDLKKKDNLGGSQGAYPAPKGGNF